MHWREEGTGGQPAGVGDVTIRRYGPGDEASWLRCRALSFLSTCYYDDVWPQRRHEDDAIEHVAVTDGTVLGLLDVSFTAPASSAEPLRATIDTVAVHPDHQRRGLAGRLLEECLAELRVRGTESLDAWTREDEPALAWYAMHGFTEEFRYVHVHADWEDDLGLPATTDGSRVVGAFLHAPIKLETAMRKRYHRVYVCRQLLRPVT